MKRTWGVLVLAALIGACSDSNEPEPEPFDATSTNAKAQAVLSALDGNTAVTTIAVLAPYMTGLGGGAVQAGLSTGPFAPASVPGAARLRTAQTLLPSLVAGPSLALFPADLLGKTFVFVPDSGRYVLDPEATGAPADGIRLVLYAVDPVLGQIVMPLQPVGTLDFIDVSTASADAVQILATIGTVTYIDYTASLSVGTTSATLSAVGTLSNGTDDLDFDLSLTATQTTASLDYQLSSGDGAVRFEAVLIDEDRFDATLTLTSGDDEAVLELAMTPSTASGQLTYNGDVVVTIAGTPDAPTFTRPDGSALTDAEVGALLAFGAIIGELFEAFDILLYPAAAILVLA